MSRRYQGLAKEVPLVVSTTAYDNGDAIGGDGLSSALKEIVIADVSVSVFLDSVRLYDDANIKADLMLKLFDSQPTAIADHAAFTLDFANLKKLVMEIPLPTSGYLTHNGNAYIRVAGKDLLTYESPVLNLKWGKLWAYLVVNAATPSPDYVASTDLYMLLSFLQDR